MLSHTCMENGLELAKALISVHYLVASQIRVPQYRPRSTMTLIMGTPNKVPLILGNPYLFRGKVSC